jgi:hypothetical protein
MSSKGEDADSALLPEQTPFYKDLAAVAVQAGFISNVESSICFACVLRLRTSPEFRPGHSHDHLFSGSTI